VTQPPADARHHVIDNPYTPHAPAPADRFVGRAREIDLIFGHLTAQQRGNVALSGPLGSGKTSLLARVADPEVAQRYGVAPPAHVVVGVDVQSVTPFTVRRFWRRVAHYLRRMPKLPLGDAIAAFLAREQPDIIDIEELLDAVSDAGSALVLLLDEFEWALQADTPDDATERRTFLAQLASLTRRSPRSLSLVIATEQPLVDAMRVVDLWRGSPFPTIFTAIALRPLAPAEVHDLVLRTQQGEGTAPVERDAEALYALSQGHPGILQAAGFALHHGRQLGLDAAAIDEAMCAAAAAVRESWASPEPAREPILPTEAPPPVGGLSIDGRTGEVVVDGRKVETLTALEYNLLRLLYDNPGRLCSKQEIIRQVWGEDAGEEIDDSRVEKLVSRLRRKIEPIPGRPQLLRTVRGRGYRYVAVPPS
jgi:hypothetical protein